MPSCSHQHLNLLDIYVVMYICSHDCPTSQWLEIIVGQQRWVMWIEPQIFGATPHASNERPNVHVKVQVRTISNVVIQVGW